MSDVDGWTRRRYGRVGFARDKAPAEHWAVAVKKDGTTFTPTSTASKMGFEVHGSFDQRSPSGSKRG
jgi:hypothetical protein